MPRYPLPPGRLLFLGSILTDPENPETSLNWRTGGVAVPAELRLDGTMAVRQQVYSELSANASALLRAVPPNSPLFHAGLKAEGRAASEVKTTVSAMHIRAEHFIPDRAYMELALAQDEVVAYARQGAFSRSMFMVVGVATAGELTVQEDASRERAAGLAANASVTGAEAEAELSVGRTARAGGTLSVAEPCEFAYRVRRFEYSKLFRRFKDKGDRNEGAMFAADANAGAESEGEFVPGLVGWDDDDICPPGSLSFQC